MYAMPVPLQRALPLGTLHAFGGTMRGATTGPFPSHSRIRHPVQPCRGRFTNQL